MNVKFWEKTNKELGRESEIKIKDLVGKIGKEYPELVVYPVDQTIPIRDIVKAYHEIKAIESQKLYNKVIVILTIINLILVATVGYLSYIHP